MIDNLMFDKLFCYYCSRKHSKTFDALILFLQQQNQQLQNNEMLKYISPGRWLRTTYTVVNDRI